MFSRTVRSTWLHHAGKWPKRYVPLGPLASRWSFCDHAANGSLSSWSTFFVSYFQRNQSLLSSFVFRAKTDRWLLSHRWKEAPVSKWYFDLAKTLGNNCRNNYKFKNMWEAYNVAHQGHPLIDYRNMVQVLSLPNVILCNDHHGHGVPKGQLRIACCKAKGSHFSSECSIYELCAFLFYWRVAARGYSSYELFSVPYRSTNSKREVYARC